MKANQTHTLAVTTAQDEVTGEVKPLFSFPVQVCSAVEQGEPTFDIAAPSGAARKQVYIDPVTDQRIEDSECMRGVRIGNEFRVIAQDDIDAINKATKLETMVALGSVNLADIDFSRQTGMYYLQSPLKGGAPSAYRLVYEGLAPVVKGKKVVRPAKAIVTKRTARSRQKLCVIYADTERKCLVLSELRFAAQLRQPDDAVLAPQHANVEQKQIDMVRQIIDNLGDGQMAIDNEVDDALVMREELIEKALSGEAIEAPTPIAASAAMDSLDSLLEASLAAAK